MQTQIRTAREARSECEQRGYHGPFTNRDRYDRYPEWRGMGDCIQCGLTRDVHRHEALLAEAAR